MDRVAFIFAGKLCVYIRAYIYAPLSSWRERALFFRICFGSLSNDYASARLNVSSCLAKDSSTQTTSNGIYVYTRVHFLPYITIVAVNQNRQKYLSSIFFHFIFSVAQGSHPGKGRATDRAARAVLSLAGAPQSSKLRKAEESTVSKRENCFFLLVWQQNSWLSNTLWQITYIELARIGLCAGEAAEYIEKRDKASANEQREYKRERNQLCRSEID